MRRARTAARAPATSLAHALTTLVLVASVSSISPTTDTLSVLGAILPPFFRERFDEVVKAASDSCEVLPQELLFSRSSLLKTLQPQLLKFTRSGLRTYNVGDAARRMRGPGALVLYVPGWWNTPSDESSRTIVEALMTKHSSVVLFDTRLSFCRGYVSAVASVPPLSQILYGFIKQLHKSGYPPSSIHIIGFSLGAHVAGLTGKLVKKQLNTTLGRITALDPARPCFTHSDYKLDKEDADFVQVIHSSTGVLGIEEPLGHADVYVNGVGGKHPECRDRSISLQCDHAQSWKLYSASAMNEQSLMGRRCANWSELLQNTCSGSETVLGYSCSPNAQGMFLYKSEEPPELYLRERELPLFNAFSFLRSFNRRQNIYS